MLPILKHATTTMLLLLLSLVTFSQTFYVNAWKDINNNRNLTYEFTAGKCDIPNDSLDMTIYTCKATGQSHPTWVDSAYTDMAIDGARNLWYVTLSGYLYSRKLDDTSSCRNVGTFLDTPATFSALVADREGAIYTAANRSDYCFLYKYDNTNGFKYLGRLPKWVQCSGDLFFYQRRLFMTCVGSRADSYFVYEIALVDPAQSCYYMSLPGITAPWVAFSVMEGKKHRVFISSTDTVNYTSSQLMEIDIQNKRVLGTVCHYPFLLRGAAAYYEHTGDTTHCPIVPIAVNETTNNDSYITVYNPSNQTIRINTNINQHNIRKIELYDLYGKKVRLFNTADFPSNMTIADLPDGMYILHIAANDGGQRKQKIIKSGG